jgi:RNAse (barnase) inhibitor barstar
MSKLIQRLNDASRSGVYRAPADDVIREVLNGSGLHIFDVSLQGAKAKDEILQRIATALRFPDWFGGNWDALEDCLDDLSWQPAQGWLVLFRDFGASPRDDFGVLVDVLGSAAEFWAEQGKLFFAVFIDPERSLNLPELYREK